jgi:hypothetical protein
MRDPLRRSGKGSSHSEHLVLAGTKGNDTLARVVQRGLGKSADSSIPRQKTGGVFLTLLCILHLI